MAAAALCAAATLAGCYTGGPDGGGPSFLASTIAPGASSGPVVAQLEMKLPSRHKFIIRGTVPVPPGTYPRPDGQTPFVVLDWDGTPAPTQVETVTRYANASDGADVLEVLARVNADPGLPIGAKVFYDVVEAAHVEGKILMDDGVLGLVTKPGNVMLVATDVFGHEYGADLARDLRHEYGLGQLRTLRDGEVALQMVTHHSMEPATQNIGAPSGALEHFLGVHSYFTAWRGENVLSLDLRVHNGHSGLDNASPLDDPLGKIYFEKIELWVPKGWTVTQSPADSLFGPHSSPAGPWNKIPIVRARSDGRMHVMPAQGQFNRRLAIVPVGHENRADHFLREQGLAFCRRGPSPSGGELYSWWNPQTARYFPQRHRLPELDHLDRVDMKNRLRQSFNQVKNQIINGNAGPFPVDTPQLGWAHPWGAKYGGMTGGSEIFIFDGVTVAEAASVDGYRLAQVTHRRYTDRHPATLYNLDGFPTRLSQWVVHGPSFDYVNMYFFLKLLSVGGDPFGLNSSPSYQRNYVQSSGLKPGYENELLSFEAIDLQHHIRLTRSPKVLVWLGNDALAKDDLRMEAEIFRLSYHSYPNNAAGQRIVSGMAHDLNFVNNNPGKGFGFGRGEAWGLDAVNATYALADDAWRAEALPWIQEIVDLVTDGQSACNGFIQSIVSSKILNGQWRARQSIEQAITENALRGTVESVLRGVDNARTVQAEFVLEKSLYAMIGPMAWINHWHGPAQYLAVAPIPVTQQPFCGSIPQGGRANGPDQYQTWSSLAYGYELTGDPLFLSRAAEMLGSGNLMPMLEGGGYNMLENRAALIAVSQQP